MNDIVYGMIACFTDIRVFERREHKHPELTNQAVHEEDVKDLYPLWWEEDRLISYILTCELHPVLDTIVVIGSTPINISVTSRKSTYANRNKTDARQKKQIMF